MGLCHGPFALLGLGGVLGVAYFFHFFVLSLGWFVVFLFCSCLALVMPFADSIRVLLTLSNFEGIFERSMHIV